MPHGLWNLGRICRIDCGSLLYATWIAEFRRRASHVENLITVPLQPPRHNVPHPIPKHTDKSQHRITHHNPRTPKKKPEGCAEGPWLYGPFAVFLFSPKTPKNIFLPTFPSKVCRKINKILVVFTIKKVYHIKINYKQ